MLRRTTIVAVILLGACHPESASPLSDCIDPPPLDLGPLLDAIDPHCAVDACTGGEGTEYCRFWLPFDALTTAQLAREPQACLDALVDEIHCRERTACTGGCEHEVATTEAACELSMPPSGPEPFDDARALCETRISCGLTPGDPRFEFDVEECEAELGARVWVEDQLVDPSCGCQLQELFRCLANADLSCDPGPAEEDAACPEESGAYSLCTTGTRCRRVGGSGSPTSCEDSISCGGTVYEASCVDGEGCTCTVGGAPGPAVAAEGCEAALRECGAPL